MPGGESAEIKSALVAKQRILTEHETESTFATWQQGMMFQLVIDSKFSRFTSTTDLGSWKATAVPHRGYTDDVTTGANAVSEAVRMTALQKEAMLQVLLGSVATFAPVISHKYITQQATCFDDIWNRLRSHYGFRVTGGRILELAQFSLNSNESHECLWERLSAFVDDNMLKKSGGIKHLGAKVEVDEVQSATLQNVTVVLWLKAIHADLPLMIKRRFATELKSNTLYSLREEISDALPSVLADMQEREFNVSFARDYRGGKSSKKFSTKSPYNTKPTYRFPPPKKKLCCLCEASNRPNANTHFLSECPFLPQDDKRYMSKIRDVVAESDSDEEELVEGLSQSVTFTHPASTVPSANRVDVLPSPVLVVSVNNREVEITLDSGAEINLISEEECSKLRLEIRPTSQKASMADGASPLQIVGEVNFFAVREHHALKFCGLVVKSLNCPILAGMPFLHSNDVFIRPKQGSICIGDCCKFKYKSKFATSAVRTCKASIIRAPQKICIHPGEEITLKVPDEFKGKDVAIEPRYIAPSIKTVPEWLPYHTTSTNTEGEIKLTNNASEPVLIKKDEQFAQVRHIDSIGSEVAQGNVPPVSPILKIPGPYADTIQVDPSKRLSNEHREAFKVINSEFDEVFSPELGKYNGASGPIKHVINMGPSLPKQRKGRNPQYSRGNKEMLQKVMDELLAKGVLAKPEDINVNVEYVSPSFLVKKPNGGHRLVTSFGELAEHAIPQPCAKTHVDEVLRHIAQWKYIIKTDLTSAYYQICLALQSLKYVGVVSPFRGTLVYQRAVMGLPGSESTLENLLCRILADLMIEGSCIKLADDLYFGADTIEKLLSAWRRGLQLLAENGLKLSPSKTIICPVSTVILGWLWENGTIRTTPHRLNTLMQCEPPSTVSKLRSFVGSYKALSKVLQYHADVLNPFEKLCATNKAASEKIDWTDELLIKFQEAKTHLSSAKVITYPRRNEALQIVTDASAKGLAATMYAIRNGKPVLAGLFNAKRKPHQIGWLPCELEALAITASVQHFSPFITQSTQRTKVLTDSSPCVQAYKKLARGEFSRSPRVTTYLSTLSHYQIELQHVAGKSNAFSDFASRNPLECDGSCQICQFVSDLEDAVVNSVSFQDVMSGKCAVPFASRGGWYSLQQECPDLRSLYKLLKAGKDPDKTQRGMKDLHRYHRKVKLSSRPADGLLIVMENLPLQPSRQRIVVPRDIVDGLLTALHLRFRHALKHQLMQLFNRAFFALDIEESAKRVVDGCHVCASLKKIPAHFTPQSTSEPPDTVGSKFSTDVIKRERQNILLVREYVSSYTDAILVTSEQAVDLKEGIVKLLCRLRSPSGPLLTLRADAGTSLQALQGDPLLTSLNIHLEIGDPKNINKNPISERAISETLEELAKLQPTGGPVSDVTLAMAMSALNSKIRNSGFSSTEVITKRDMITGKPLDINDEVLIEKKQEERKKNHQPSATYKARGKTVPEIPDIKRGDLVYIYQDREKGRCRDGYIVVKSDEEYVWCQKLVGNQLRSKKYRVKLTDIIAVSKPTVEISQSEPECSEPVCTQAKPSEPVYSEHKVEQPKSELMHHNLPDSDSEDCLSEIVITLNQTEPGVQVRMGEEDIDESIQDREDVSEQSISQDDSDQDNENDESGLHQLFQSDQDSDDDPTLSFCPICSEEVREEQDGLLCDHCQLWFHRECVGMSKRRYKELHKSERFEWSCPIQNDVAEPRRISTRSHKPPGMILSHTP